MGISFIFQLQLTTVPKPEVNGIDEKAEKIKVTVSNLRHPKFSTETLGRQFVWQSKKYEHQSDVERW